VLREFFISALQKKNSSLLAQSAFFLKVAASSRFASNVKMLLNETSTESWIGREEHMNLSAHSPKLTSTDFFYGV
jgi:hypothetical protein